MPLPIHPYIWFFMHSNVFYWEECKSCTNLFEVNHSIVQQVRACRDVFPALPPLPGHGRTSFQAGQSLRNGITWSLGVLATNEQVSLWEAVAQDRGHPTEATSPHSTRLRTQTPQAWNTGTSEGAWGRTKSSRLISQPPAWEHAHPMLYSLCFLLKWHPPHSEGLANIYQLLPTCQVLWWALAIHQATRSALAAALMELTTWREQAPEIFFFPLSFQIF